MEDGKVQEEVKRIPYGMMNFVAIREDNYYYVDKTRFIEKVEKSNRYFFPQIRNYAHDMIQKRKESASLVKRVHSTANVTIKTYKYPLPHHAT